MGLLFNNNKFDLKNKTENKKSLTLTSPRYSRVYTVTHGCTRALPRSEDPAEPCSPFAFWFWAMFALGVTSMFEVLGMYVDSLVSSLRVAEAVGLSIVPLNERRVEIASSLARAARASPQTRILIALNSWYLLGCF